jgi:hypothetical protein
MLLQGQFESPSTITVTRRKDADGKDEDHLFFDTKPTPGGEPPAPDKGKPSEPAQAQST